MATPAAPPGKFTNESSISSVFATATRALHFKKYVRCWSPSAQLSWFHFHWVYLCLMSGGRLERQRTFSGSTVSFHDLSYTIRTSATGKPCRSSDREILHRVRFTVPKFLVSSEFETDHCLYVLVPHSHPLVPKIWDWAAHPLYLPPPSSFGTICRPQSHSSNLFKNH